MRRGRTPSLALVLAALALASVTAAASDADDARIHLSRERRRVARGGGVHPATVGEGSAGLVDVPFDTKPIRGVRGGEFPTAVPGGRARFLGGLEVTFTSPASSDETPDAELDPLSYGGWSSATGNADGSVAWILTDNYARLMRVELRNEPSTGRLDAVTKISDATAFRFRFPDADDGAPVERTPGTRIDTESIVRIPHAADGNDSPGGDASFVLNDFVVGVEDAQAPGVRPNNLLRLGNGVAGGYRNVPGAAEAFSGDDACGVNLGPEATVYLPSRYTFAGSLPEGAYPGSVIVAMCEARNDAGVVTGFILDASSASTGGGGLGLIGKLYLRGLGDALAPGRFQCGASDATLTPDGSIVVVLFHCYDFVTGDHVASLRTVRADSLRVPGATVHVSPLMDWDDGPIGNMEGVHAFKLGNDGAIGVLMVSDNNLSPTTNTQIVEFEVRGPLFDESVAAGAASSSSAVLGDLEGGGGDGATMLSPLRRPFRAAPWVGVRKRDARVGASIAGFVAVTALVAIGSIVGRRRSAVDARRVRSETSLLLPR